METATQKHQEQNSQADQFAQSVQTKGQEELNFIQGSAKFMDDGGVFMWIILGIWVVGLALVLERVKSLFKYDIDGLSLMGRVKKSVLVNEVQKAIQDCAGSKSLLAQVLRNGLKRANQTKEQIKDALESSILEVTPLAEKRLNYIALIANVSTLLGLLGTIQGLIASFSAVASADPSQKAQLLALGISTAMNTTALGLLSAISLMVMHSFLTNKSEKIIGDVEHYSVKLLDLLGTKRSMARSEVNSSDEMMPPIPEDQNAA